jgi:probable rRNA maturation factor
MARPIAIYCGVPDLDFSEEEVRTMLHRLDDQGSYAIPPGELSVAFLDGVTLRTMHGEFLGDPTPTDVITFPGDREENFAGEICVSVEEAADYAATAGNDFAEELALYLVHGWLHLAGLDDRSPTAAAAMRDAEKKLLHFLRDQGLLPQFTVTPSQISPAVAGQSVHCAGENPGNCE